MSFLQHAVHVQIKQNICSNIKCLKFITFCTSHLYFQMTRHALRVNYNKHCTLYCSEKIHCFSLVFLVSTISNMPPGKQIYALRQRRTFFFPTRVKILCIHMEMLKTFSSLFKFQHFSYENGRGFFSWKRV